MKIKDCGIYTSRKGEKFVFDDIVREADEGVYFISKNRLPKINDIDINTLDIIELIETSRYLYEIYVDEVYMNCISSPLTKVFMKIESNTKKP